jgi:hypothetical protein
VTEQEDLPAVSLEGKDNYE